MLPSVTTSSRCAIIGNTATGKTTLAQALVRAMRSKTSHGFGLAVAFSATEPAVHAWGGDAVRAPDGSVRVVPGVLPRHCVFDTADLVALRRLRFTNVEHKLLVIDDFPADKLAGLRRVLGWGCGVVWTMHDANKASVVQGMDYVFVSVTSSPAQLQHVVEALHVNQDALWAAIEQAEVLGTHAFVAIHVPTRTMTSCQTVAPEPVHDTSSREARGTKRIDDGSDTHPPTQRPKPTPN